MGVGDGPCEIPESSQTISEISEIHENLEVGQKFGHQQNLQENTEIEITSSFEPRVVQEST